jgi:hypothetical protein
VFIECYLSRRIIGRADAASISNRGVTVPLTAGTVANNGSGLAPPAGDDGRPRQISSSLR